MLTSAPEMAEAFLMVISQQARSKAEITWGGGGEQIALENF